MSNLLIVGVMVCVNKSLLFFFALQIFTTTICCWFYYYNNNNNNYIQSTINLFIHTNLMYKLYVMKYLLFLVLFDLNLPVEQSKIIEYDKFSRKNTHTQTHTHTSNPKFVECLFLLKFLNK